MNKAKALHTSARLYCCENYNRWAEQYRKLPNGGRAKDGYNYSDEALDTFPRYRILANILVEVMRINPDTLVDLEHTRVLILNAGKIAKEIFTQGAHCPIETSAILEECETFYSYIRKLNDSELANVQPLPDSRVLTTIESEYMWNLLRERWQIHKRDYWYPLTECTLDDIEAFQDKYFHDFCSSFALDELLISHGVTRLWEFCEDGLVYEQEVSIIEPCYYGEEAYWTSGDMDWIIYASHENSITIGGWLLREVKAAWPEWKQRIYPT